MAIFDVIKYEGGNNILVWKHPKEDFNTSAQLIIHESQEAFVYKDGKLVGPYQAGKHTIKTDNIPGICHLVGLLTGGVSPNHYEVYFVNKAVSMDIFWGSSAPWTIQDQSVQISFEVQARGQFAIRIINSKLLLLRLIGATSSFTQQTLQNYFSGIMLSKIKDFITNLIYSEGLSYTEFNAHLVYISEKVRPQLTKSLEKYGLSLEEFVVEDIGIVKNDAYNKLEDAMATRAINTIIGVTEQEKMAYGVAKIHAANPGIGGQFRQLATGVASGMAMAPSIGATTQDVIYSVASSNIQHRDQFSMGTVRKRGITQELEKIKCGRCGAVLDSSACFCSECGIPIEKKKIAITFCPVCGKEIPTGSKFCKSCGTKL